MISAVVLLNTQLDSRESILENLRLVEGVEEAHALFGVYDVIIKIKAKTVEKLKEMLQRHIRQVAGVVSSLTLMIVGESQIRQNYEDII